MLARFGLGLYVSDKGVVCVLGYQIIVAGCLAVLQKDIALKSKYNQSSQLIMKALHVSNSVCSQLFDSYCVSWLGRVRMLLLPQIPEFAGNSYQA